MPVGERCGGSDASVLVTATDNEPAQPAVACIDPPVAWRLLAVPVALTGRLDLGALEDVAGPLKRCELGPSLLDLVTQGAKGAARDPLPLSVTQAPPRRRGYRVAS